MNVNGGEDGSAKGTSLAGANDSRGEATCGAAPGPQGREIEDAEEAGGEPSEWTSGGTPEVGRRCRTAWRVKAELRFLRAEARLARAATAWLQARTQLRAAWARERRGG